MPNEKKAEQIIITRYSSRRLYNSNSSDYVTLDEVAELIRDGNDIKIIDKKTGDDLTRQILLQIITEHESRGENILPLNVLTDIVRSFSDQAAGQIPGQIPGLIPEFLEQSFGALKKQQQELLSTFDPSRSLAKLQQWQQTQSGVLDSIMQTWTGGLAAGAQDNNKAAGEEDTPPPTEEKSHVQSDLSNQELSNEVERLKKQFEELQEKISKS
jgi:polyhydroxyalkanoate synthesis repressor PhaR